MGVSANGFGISFWGDDNVVEGENRDGAPPCEYTKSHWSGHFNRVDFMVCEFYLNF